MVLGLTAAIIILKAAAMLAGFGFGFAYQSGIFATAGDASGILLRLIGVIAAIVIFTILIIAIATSTFTLIYRVPDYVIDMLGWKAVANPTQDAEARIQRHGDQSEFQVGKISSSAIGGVTQKKRGHSDDGGDGGGNSGPFSNEERERKNRIKDH